MVDREYIESQLKKIGFGRGRINRAEIKELENILIPDEIIYECVNGYYDGGMALLVATDIRALLIDKKIMGFLNVEDIRFDMISDLDYSHRIFGAQISINSGMSKLIFKSYNQVRLRKTIGHIQQRMSEIKREQNQHVEVQKQHLEDINKQLQMYLLAQHNELQRNSVNVRQSLQEKVRPSPQLSDYLFAQRLLEDFKSKGGVLPKTDEKDKQQQSSEIAHVSLVTDSDNKLREEMIEAGRQEVFGKNEESNPKTQSLFDEIPHINKQGIEISFFRIACAKIPYLLNSRRYNQSL